jgi:hypothetical protein
MFRDKLTFFKSGTDSKKAEITQARKEALDAYNSGDRSKTIATYEKLVDKLSLMDNIRAKAMIAYQLFARNEGSDRAEAVKIYKDLIGDLKNPPLARAIVLDDLADLLAFSSEEFIRENFNEAPYSTYFPKLGEPFNSRVFAIGLWKYSDELYPNALAKFSIVYTQSHLFISDSLPKSIDKIAFANELNKTIVDGNGLLKDKIYENSRMIEMYMYRAIGIGNVAKILKNYTLAEQEDAYKLALSEGEKYAVSVYGVKNLYRIRFYYATFVKKNFGEDRVNDIVQILKPYSTEEAISSDTLKNYYQSLLKQPDTYPVKQQVFILAKVSPDFKKYLQTIGQNF